MLATPIQWTTATPATPVTAASITEGSARMETNYDPERSLLKKEHAAKKARLDEEYFSQKAALEKAYLEKEML